MTIEKIFSIITHGIKDKITELELVMAIQKLTDVSFERAAVGYRLMREKGIINDAIDKNTIGELETMESNVGLMLIIRKFDAVLTNINELKWKPTLSKKPSEHAPNEIIPKTKMTRVEISEWLSTPNKPTDSQNYTEFKRLYD